MKRYIFFTFLIHLSIHCFGQLEYYQSAFNKKGDSLKYELNQIIKNHIEFPYSSTNTDVWDILKATDKDPANGANIILLYSGRSVDAEQEYNNGNGWNREHVWAKSRGDFGTTKGAGTDVHHLRPTDVGINSARSNKAFDECNVCIQIEDTDSYRDADLWTFEPRDAVKGDVARMIFYMVVRYEGENGEPDLELTNDILGNQDKTPIHGVINTLMAWHTQDPVDQWEENRNEIIYSDYQGNRNPFIDNPELADYLWGDKLDERWNEDDVVLGIDDLEESDLIIYPNPTNGDIRIIGDYEQISIYDSQGKIMDQELIYLRSGVYYIEVLRSNSRKEYHRILKY